MDALRLFVLAASIGSSMVGGLYAAAELPARHATEPTAIVLTPAADLVVEPLVESEGELAVEELPEGIELPEGQDVPDDVATLVDYYAEEILDPETGLRMGLLSVPHPELASTEPVAAASRTRARPRAPIVPIPRLSADPGRHVILTARAMMARGETVRGSCYRYLSEVFARAGHDGWRTRSIVHSSEREGPYANLDLIRPGDWLYIVNHPEATPVGTHSVLFVGWEDRASGHARVIEHSGWGAGASTGQERGYDVSRTYRIVRPIMPR